MGSGFVNIGAMVSIGYIGHSLGTNGYFHDGCRPHPHHSLRTPSLPKLSLSPICIPARAYGKGLKTPTYTCSSEWYTVYYRATIYHIPNTICLIPHIVYCISYTIATLRAAPYECARPRVASPVPTALRISCNKIVCTDRKTVYSGSHGQQRAAHPLARGHI